ncbi:hypothetical protein [Amycolatopsis anabasis]|uniref:hypothetical protein n=1 Tax=Amycolatopsis anabasis TaxID=1840409 RepID=UPI0031B5C3F6
MAKLSSPAYSIAAVPVSILTLARVMIRTPRVCINMVASAFQYGWPPTLKPVTTMLISLPRWVKVTIRGGDRAEHHACLVRTGGTVDLDHSAARAEDRFREPAVSRHRLHDLVGGLAPASSVSSLAMILSSSSRIDLLIGPINVTSSQ